MLYFAYGSNLNHFQMKKRCKDSKYIKKFEIKDFRLTFRSKYGVADIERKKNYLIFKRIIIFSQAKGFFNFLLKKAKS